MFLEGQIRMLERFVKDFVTQVMMQKYFNQRNKLHSKINKNTKQLLYMIMNYYIIYCLLFNQCSLGAQNRLKDK